MGLDTPTDLGSSGELPGLLQSVTDLLNICSKCREYAVGEGCERLDSQLTVLRVLQGELLSINTSRGYRLFKMASTSDAVILECSDSLNKITRRLDGQKSPLARKLSWFINDRKIEGAIKMLATCIKLISSEALFLSFANIQIGRPQLHLHCHGTLA